MRLKKVQIKLVKHRFMAKMVAAGVTSYVKRYLSAILSGVMNNK